MECNLYPDNRDSGVNFIPSSNVPYTGYVSESFKDHLPCKPNVNDLIKLIEDSLDTLTTSLGDNTKLNPQCLGFTPATATQQTINQQSINLLCSLRADVEDLKNKTIDPSTLQIAIDLLCLQQQGCEPQTTYSLLHILTQLVSSYCNLQDRVQNIENILNI
jgi:hypothetical protein